MLQPLIMHLDQLCRTGQPGNGIPPTDQVISIDLPVGQGFKAKNLDGDVRTIQDSLNKIKPQQGGPVVALAVDGKCGPKTNKAIHDFQFKQFGFSGADGLIEPGKQTIQRINQLLFSNQPIDPSVHADIKTKMVSHMNLVTRSTHAAQANLMAAITPAGGLDFGRTSANDRLDRHFALGGLSANARDQAIRKIQEVFTMYLNVLVMPGALGTGAFEMDPTGDPRIAFTFGNGFFLKDQIDPARDIRLDRTASTWAVALSSR